MTHRIHCVELGNVAVPGMRIKVRWFPDGARDDRVWRASSNILSFRRVVGEPVQHRDVSKRSSSFQRDNVPTDPPSERDATPARQRQGAKQ